jgi:hypothetical protein
MLFSPIYIEIAVFTHSADDTPWRHSGLAPPKGRKRRDILKWVAADWGLFPAIIGRMRDHGGVLPGYICGGDRVKCDFNQM